MPNTKRGSEEASYKKSPRHRSREKAGASNQSGAQPAAEAIQTRGPVDFPIVGIGASAGGQDAFKQFFCAMPVDGRMAFMLVQHLHTTLKSLMVDRLLKTSNED